MVERRVAKKKTKQAGREGTRRRLLPEERKSLIVAEAVRFFSEVGFDGNTRELASRLGITQPLLFRYFPSKEALIERAYQEVFPQRWSPEWDALLNDSTKTLRQRLIEFYTDYARKCLSYESIRLFLFARLSGNPLFKPYLKDARDKVSQRVVQRIVLALYQESGMRTNKDGHFSEHDLELAWGFQESIMYYGIRCVVHGIPPVHDIERLIALKVDAFLEGAKSMIRPRQGRVAKNVRFSPAKASPPRKSARETKRR